jgi:hypothetical protein
MNVAHARSHPAMNERPCPVENPNYPCLVAVSPAGVAPTSAFVRDESGDGSHLAALDGRIGCQRPAS